MVWNQLIIGLIPSWFVSKLYDKNVLELPHMKKKKKYTVTNNLENSLSWPEQSLYSGVKIYID